MMAGPGKPSVQSPGRRGFSLLELMIVVTVLGILATLAVPGFRHSLARAHRVETIGKMLQAANCQERIFAKRRAYDMDACLPAEDGRYLLEYAPPDPGNPGGYLLLARPRGPQTRDDCGYLGLDHIGVRTVGNIDADPVRCWSGR